MTAIRKVTATCGDCGDSFQRWRGDGQRNRTDAELRCKSCMSRPHAEADPEGVIPDHVTVRQNVDLDTLDDQRRDTINLDVGVLCEINIVLNGKIVVQIIVDDDRQYTVFDAERDGVDGAL